ncbi:MAG TPA: hypothetical protein VGS07_18710 [Thermoanaerobaculia bacterium]|jgi:hypothetical protein|nr:hypothetical protein [Thermoanaerobaculia bacterium]
MAQTFDAGHEETERDLPGPLQSGWYPGIWALPATTLSAASLVVLGVVLIFLLAGETSRALFRLPFAPGWALAAAVLAWAVALACRNRPGRQPPRVWVLGLAAGSTILTLVCFLGGDLARSPYVHAGALAALAASVTLLPRLLPLQPDDRLVQHIAPLALAFVLFVTLPVSFYIGRRAVEDQKRRVGETIAELSREAGEVREVSAFPWNSPERRQDALREMQRLQVLPLEQWLPDRYLWQGAAHLGEDGQLAAAYRGLLDAVVAGIDPARTPKLWQSQFTGSSEGWSRDPLFPDLSAAVAGYHLRTGQLLQRLAPPSGESAALRELATYYDQSKQEVDKRLEVLAKTWNEDWVPPLIAGRGPASGPALSPLSDLLRRPLPPDDSLRPASLEKLLDLKRWQARKMADPKRGCGERPYREGDFQYFRIDCYAYAARLGSEPPGADLRIEMRIVYKSEVLGSLERSDLPTELYFLFPVPTGTDPEKYREDVMNALKAAVRAEYQGMELTLEDRTSSAGFTFQTGPRAPLVKVTPTRRVKDLSGGISGIEVYARTAATGRSRPAARR